ncbi:GntR family transcriptional regulator [Caballeronia sp. LP006]|jgi:DNA-binding GntR family transcriptional regulator|uniref:GntR family transcriptional regulator n=1 Tax=unclassified Caballeronia TaxID=2646786 RepID=UPI001FD22D3A|nr:MULTISPECIES: GntR family transcriptional regulator [unclassified Caballeronia]MDR5774218.1 GntR family transcriptional regulator [Caballeronia sp. LZ002]MDR5805751.1 GntR family transcriptional regulator [Caballeronia sp. LZ001]MDR5826995.1 GntR family transcriptional regulator [Caballeronia sp. LP006]MDR5849653.1 GntR family transcriptional regulator [Caballeronia sp. LZ003]
MLKTVGETQKLKPRKTGDGDNTSEEIYEQIYVALLEHRLVPGTKLAEERLASIFGVNRARVRDALSRLAYEQIVEVYPKKGWFVAKPSVDQARDVFEARRVIEPAVIARLTRSITPDKLAQMREHLRLEMDARERSDKRAVIRLSGEFHNLVATLAGNSSFTRSVRELSTLTCLVILLYNAPITSSCRADEHTAIVDAIAKGDGDKAAELMLHHLDHIQSALNLDVVEEEVDLEAIFKR